MSDFIDIGKQVKKIRLQKKLTLKDLSERTELSIGFLSQFERGLTTIAIDSLSKIAKILEIDMSTFFTKPKVTNDEISLLRSYEREVSNVTSQFVQYNLINNIESADILPRIFSLLPFVEHRDEVTTYQHQGSELIFMLEGVLTLRVGEKNYELYPGDCVYFDSHRLHNWQNNTNKMVLFMTVNTPNPYAKIEEQ